MKKIGGYVLGALGLVSLALGVKIVNTAIVKSIPALAGISSYVFTVIGLVLLVLAVVFLRGSGRSKQPPEVPIYHGKNVVGYRVMKK